MSLEQATNTPEAGSHPPNGQSAAAPPRRRTVYCKTRTFSCPTCGAHAFGKAGPPGWYLLNRATTDGTEAISIGAYCTLPCLVRSQRRHEEVAAANGPRLGFPEDDLELRREQLETVMSLMHRGMTVRQAGDQAGISTKTVRNWLQAAGIALTDGRLTGINPSMPPKQRPAPAAEFRAAHSSTSAVGGVNELAQIYVLLDLDWDTTSSGPPHNPTFTTVVSATRADTSTRLDATGTDRRKARAKELAAQELLNQLKASPGSSS
ncbi:hypothetical protein J7I98_13675 [Streptomyces sp. ISL-98]|uniref:hypothetical protein n=1 Tax=Streptomyces sp. ISL-98 TaxID=2819192 RepID=UPI001BEC443D|nr:hypothetical protein [Streptomyces sp. ISL-98]MBT2506923.1 hypothetical protein [Streptomyces sp. ISL-98]